MNILREVSNVNYMMLKVRDLMESFEVHHKVVNQSPDLVDIMNLVENWVDLDVDEVSDEIR